MKEDIFDLPVKLVAHRGYSSKETENTKKAFIEAGKKAFYGIECDVHLTKDGKYIIHHDDDTKRLAKSNFIIKNTEYNVLKNLPFIDINTKKFDESINIPTLEEYLKICKEYDKVSIIEIKAIFNKEEIKGMFDIIKEHGDINKTVIISFDLNNLLIVREIDKNIPIQYLLDKYDDSLIDLCKKFKFDVDFHYGALKKENIKKFHDNGIKVNVWTVNDFKTIEKMIEYNVDYITTNG
ncbi:glycerophosphodiester phosphodiesterase family protein [Haploplasma axanthum]|uniref:Glycerophosphodiester phosphodiesterase family protein n=1 Tax=Haploplasma axanthum TaxID=29552 RepID=A0A449BBN8_HAPAX|nr:glycerophosphodiester phosphodiesterase family protein [Haploplasma axanthum]VEU79863.1 glycerophosphodiester phosphodiesterase family protein [Haploplasma axanthum]